MKSIVKLRSSQAAVQLCRNTGSERLTADMVLVDNPDLSALRDQVEYVAPNHRFKRSQPMSGETSQVQWALHNVGQEGGKVDADIDAPEAWAVSTGADVLVAVLDTGLDLTHPDLQANLYTNKGETPGDGIDNDNNGVVDDIHGYDAAEHNGNPWTDDSHGTHCAGIVAAVGRVTGVAPSARILPIKIYDEEEWTDAATIIRALQYARQAGAQVASHSYGGLLYNRAVEEMFEKSSMLHVVAAGNYAHNNDEKKNYPASYELPNLLSVAASDRHDNIADFSNFGPGSVHLAAPGVEVLSTTAYGNLGTWSGTSMACPHVAGAAALVASKFSEESPTEWKARLLNSVDKQPGWEKKTSTGGRLNAYRALTEH
jgi:subtilisin family serine protease